VKTDFFLPFFQRKKYELEKSVLPRTRERERERGSSVVVVLVLVVYRRAGIFYTFFFFSCYYFSNKIKCSFLAPLYTVPVLSMVLNSAKEQLARSVKPAVSAHATVLFNASTFAPSPIMTSIRPDGFKVL